MFKTIEEFQKFSKDQFDAATKPATALSHGLQQVASETADFTKKSLEANSDVMQKLLGTRSMETAMQIHMDFAKTTYESMVAESSKIGGMITSVAQDAFKPLEGAFAQFQSTASAGVPAV